MFFAISVKRVLYMAGGLLAAMGLIFGGATLMDTDNPVSTATQNAIRNGKATDSNAQADCRTAQKIISGIYKAAAENARNDAAKANLQVTIPTVGTDLHCALATLTPGQP